MENDIRIVNKNESLVNYVNNCKYIFSHIIIEFEAYI